MKSTPFYELSVALRGRSKIFQGIIIGSFTASLFVMIVCGSQLLKTQDTPEKSSRLQHAAVTITLASIHKK